MSKPGSGVIASPNIWHWPMLYEIENRAQDADDQVFPALRSICDWAGAHVVDIGCGSGFHLPRFAATAASVIGVEPYAPLVAQARARVADLPNVRIVRAVADELPLPDSSVDVVHARTAYFFDERCTPGIAEAMRVLRPGGWLIVVDLDATAPPYGEWMRADLPHYRPADVEAFFTARGFATVRVLTRWEFADRSQLRAVLGIEFSKRTAARAEQSVPGLAFSVGYRIHSIRKPAGLRIR